MDIELEVHKDRCTCRFIDGDHDLVCVCHEGDKVYLNNYPNMEQRWSFDKYEETTNIK